MCHSAEITLQPVTRHLYGFFRGDCAAMELINLTITSLNNDDNPFSKVFLHAIAHQILLIIIITVL